MRQIREVQEKRRSGWDLSEIIEELLRNSEKLLEEYGNPFEVLSQSGVQLQQEKEQEWLDMTTENWCTLSVEKQIEYATAYQKWYAKELNEPLEKEVKGGGTSIAMKRIPPGKFWMGSPESEANRGSDEVRHKVVMSKAFWCGKYEVTQAQWERVMGSNPSQFEGNNLPVEQVNWEETQSFCKKTGMKLLTEAQWEYACRGGTTTEFNIGGNITAEEVNYNGGYPYKNGEKGTFRKKTMEVGSFSGNSWGLYDMHGNVWEWCEDGYGDYPSGEVLDSTGASSGSSRVVRGGCWFRSKEDCRSANRDECVPMCRDINMGFRVSS